MSLSISNTAFPCDMQFACSITATLTISRILKLRLTLLISFLVVTQMDSILRPGGRIQGAIHCSQVGSELKIFEELKRPLQISSDYASSSSPNHRKRISIMTREKAGVALHARSDPHQQLGVQPNKPSTVMGNPNSHEPSAISKPLLDHFGHPLIGSAPMHDVDALRKNRELVQATRAFLDSAMAVKTNDQHQFRVGNTDNDNDTDSNPLPAFLR